MNNFSALALIAFAFIAGGVFVFCLRQWGGGGGNGGQPVVTPSSRWPGGGFQPGFVSTQVRQGGVGSASPNVQFN
jgi:hypothetical protein